MVGIFITASLLCFLIGFKYSNSALIRQTETFQHSQPRITCFAKVIHFVLRDKLPVKENT